jgi:hypothetical protein
MTQPAQPEWRNTNPLHDLVDRKRATIVILRPSLKGHYEATVGYCEMKHGWSISIDFSGERPRTIEDWDPAWLWCLAPERSMREAQGEVIGSAIFCEHANENPSRCPCKPGCYCRSHTCKDKR